MDDGNTQINRICFSLKFALAHSAGKNYLHKKISPWILAVIHPIRILSTTKELNKNSRLMRSRE